MHRYTDLHLFQPILIKFFPELLKAIQKKVHQGPKKCLFRFKSIIVGSYVLLNLLLCLYTRTLSLIFVATADSLFDGHPTVLIQCFCGYGTVAICYLFYSLWQR